MSSVLMCCYFHYIQNLAVFSSSAENFARVVIKTTSDNGIKFYAKYENTADHRVTGFVTVIVNRAQLRVIRLFDI